MIEKPVFIFTVCPQRGTRWERIRFAPDTFRHIYQMTRCMGVTRLEALKCASRFTWMEISTD